MHCSLNKLQNKLTIYWFKDWGTLQQGLHSPQLVLGKYKMWVCIYLKWRNLGQKWQFLCFWGWASTKHDCAFTWFDGFGAKSANFPALHVRQVQVHVSVHLLAFIYFRVQSPCHNRPTYNATFGNKSKFTTMTMPIFNENWEHLPLNPIHLQPQLTANSTKNDNAYRGNLPH